MIRWCAYCQTYIGESAPFDRYDFTHGICPKCIRSHALMDEAGVARIRPVADYFAKVGETGNLGDAPRELLAEGLALGLDPWDLLMGIVTPALRRIGERWANGEVPASAECRLSQVTSAILALLSEDQPHYAALRETPRPEVVLVSPPGNHHNLGVQLVAFFLLTRNISVKVLPACLSTPELVAMVEHLAPRKVGISCALPEHLRPTREIVTALAALPEPARPRVYVGGYALRGQEACLEGWPCQPCTTPADLLGPSEGTRTPRERVDPRCGCGGEGQAS